MNICAHSVQIMGPSAALERWHQVETYVGSRSEAKFSHGICPACWDKVVGPQFIKETGKNPGGYPK